MLEVKNYTQDQVSKMAAEYRLADTDEDRIATIKGLANNLGRNPRSVISKLYDLGKYKKVTKPDDTTVRKITIVSSIASRVGIQTNDIKSFGKATKTKLEVFLKALVKVAVKLKLLTPKK